MTSGSCPRCRSVLEEDSSFCHSCGLDLKAAAASGPPTSGPAAPFQPVVPPFPVLPGPGLEVPVYPMEHGRALAALAGILILFNASIVLVFGIIYMADRSIGWEEVWQGDDWYEERVIYWEWVMASVLMMGAFGVGIAGGIASAKGTRFTLAMVSALLLLAVAVLLQADWHRWLDEEYGQVVFVLVLAILPVILLLMSKDSFTEPKVPPGRGHPAYPTDNYGWSRTQDVGMPRTVGRRRGGPS